MLRASPTDGEEAAARARVSWRQWALVAAAGGATVGSVGVAVAQVTVDGDVVSATRTCGSAFDAITDRSGWQQWWASDLDEPDEAVRSALIRTNGCPAAVNRRVVVATVLAALGVMSMLFASLHRRLLRRRPGGDRSHADRLGRLGRTVSWVAVALLIAGIAGIIAVVADADSTLFLYVDRAVVAIVGLVVLVPVIALFAIGRAATIVGAGLERRTHDEECDA